MDWMECILDAELWTLWKCDCATAPMDDDEP